MIEAYKKFWMNFVNFSGRTTRRDFWLAILCNMIVSFLLGFVAGFLKLGFLTFVFALATCIPSFSMAFRRLHDSGKSAWFLLLGLVPMVGFIILIVLYCLPSDQNPNTYGSNM